MPEELAWRFSDGTIVHLGGKVEGESELARELREGIADPTTGVQIWPMPSEGVPLDVNDPAILNQYVRQRAYFGILKGRYKLVAAPKVPPLPPPPWGDDEDDDGDGLKIY